MAKHLVIALVVVGLVPIGLVVTDVATSAGFVDVVAEWDPGSETWMAMSGHEARDRAETLESLPRGVTMVPHHLIDLTVGETRWVRDPATSDGVLIDASGTRRKPTGKAPGRGHALVAGQDILVLDLNVRSPALRRLDLRAGRWHEHALPNALADPANLYLDDFVWTGSEAVAVGTRVGEGEPGLRSVLVVLILGLFGQVVLAVHLVAWVGRQRKRVLAFSVRYFPFALGLTVLSFAFELAYGKPFRFEGDFGGMAAVAQLAFASLVTLGVGLLGAMVVLFRRARR